jgi:hypothetical protein
MDMTAGGALRYLGMAAGGDTGDVAAYDFEPALPWVVVRRVPPWDTDVHLQGPPLPPDRLTVYADKAALEVRRGEDLPDGTPLVLMRGVRDK